MPLENLIGVVLNKTTELKKYFHKLQEEPIARDGITEYDINRIKGEYNDKQQSNERTERND